MLKLAYHRNTNQEMYMSLQSPFSSVMTPTEPVPHTVYWNTPSGASDMSLCQSPQSQDNQEETMSPMPFFSQAEDLEATFFADPKPLTIPRMHRESITKVKFISSKMAELHQNKLSLTTILTMVLENTDPSSPLYVAQEAFY